MKNLQIHCLGGFRSSLGDNQLTGFHSSKAQALLGYLAVTGRPHSRSALAGLLWRDLTEANARANLRKVLSNLRRLVGPYLSITRYEAGVNHKAPFWLDVAVFEEGAAPGNTVEQLVEAVSNYQGDFLYGFDVKDAPAFEQWSLSQRARLRELAAQALDTLMVHFSVKQDFAAGIRHAKQLLQIEPWRENAHRQLMKLLAQTGQRSAALKQYESCRQLLLEELGVEPDAETEALYDAIRSDELEQIITTPSIYHPVASAQDASRVRHNLPLQPTPLIGRETELASLNDFITNPDVRLLTILGAGGMGKTRLALAAAEAQLDHFANGAFFVPLAPVQVVDTIVPTIAHALGFSFAAGGTPHEQLLNYLRSKQLLLVMDNYEHLLDGLGIVADILQNAMGVKVLATSRAKLGLQGEWLFPVSGMAFPETVTQKVLETNAIADVVEEAQQYGAVKLFVQSAKRVRKGYELSPDDYPYVVRICWITQGMPLAILLAAAWIEIVTPREIVYEIDQGMDFLETDLQDVPDRHQSMRAVFDSSWDIITNQEQQIFAALSVFRGGFSRSAAQEVTGASLRELISLAGKSLIHRDPSGRFSIHELLRQYAADHLSQSPAEYDTVKDQHSAFYCAEMHERETEWKSGKEVAAFSAIEIDFENVRPAWSWAAERGRFRWLDQAMDSLGEFYSWNARYQEGEASFGQAAAKLKELTSGSAGVSLEAKQVHAKVLVWQAEFNREFLGKRERAENLLKESQSLLRNLELAGQDIRREKALLLKELARLARDEGDLKKERELWQQSLNLSRELGDREWIAHKIGGFAWLAAREGNFDEAYQRFKEAQLLWQELGNTMYVTNMLGGLGFVAMKQGQLEESERLLRKRMAISRERGKMEKIVNPHQQLGATLLYSGKFHEALAVVEEGIHISIESGKITATTALYGTRTSALAHLGRYEQARILEQEVHNSTQKIIGTIHGGYALFAVSMVSLADEAYEEARQLLHESVAICRKMGRRSNVGSSLALLGITQWELGQIAQARQSLLASFALALEIRSFPMLLTLLPAAAHFLASEGQKSRAVEVYALVSRYPFVANSIWFADVVGQKIAAAASALPPEMVTRARERGRALDLWNTAAELSTELVQAK